ncbi:TPA: alanine racemase [Klebsiella aerogenes]|uniref:alanine racemase n=1 Tax=Klebsiella TaxID=570 RepID=UPI00066519D8|nr:MULTISPECIES: alanine racemase [Klebsiella]MDU3694352.1 alanine racemase [Klebsiella michiganensis]AXS53287.1 alanine racemase [Klebsiella pneumoniae]ELI6976499.1 alanine racemase [Klebsiella pneumoniae]ELQ9026001.1 alanine racemase [Klebsiella oxytoca]MBD0763577.1 alanine racemase [Klebsiella variicola]
MKTATAVISRRALRHNLQQVRRLAPHSRLIAVIKANAYGHGALETALALKDADGYGVARLTEALALRRGGITKPILLMEGFFSTDELPLLASHHFETTIHNIEQLTALEHIDLPHPVTVWMKLDTGMHRLGFSPDQAGQFYQRLCNCRNVVQPVNIMSHLCCADEPERDTTLRQLECFDAFIQNKPGLHSIAASSGILLWPQAHHSQVRSGIILYGVSPLATQTATDFGFEPVMTLTSHLIAVREHKAGEPVGYGSTWTSPHNTRLGVVAMGYGDGYPRCAPYGTPVLINGREVPLAGKVSMDMITVDLGPDAKDLVGAQVIFWGKMLPVERIASHTGISAGELITRLTQRTKLVYIDD